MSELVDAIPVTGFAVRLLGDPGAFSHAGGRLELARPYATNTDAWKAYHKIAEALGVAETPQVRNADAVARLVVHALAPPHPPVIVGSSVASIVDSKLIWSRACIDGEPDTIRIMPDFAGAYSWCEAGCQISVDFAFPGLPGIETMHEAFAAWQRPFDLAEWEPTTPMLPGFDWPPFHAAGIALPKVLKLLLGDRCQVLYEKPYEDPGRGADERLVMALRR